MRFSQAWASVSTQNVTLRLVLMSLSVCLCLMAVIATRMALKDPLLIERSCYSTVITSSSANHSESEVDAFVHEALSQRFNTESNTLAEYLSLEEAKQREQEQGELKRREMKQRVLVNSVVKVGDVFNVDADRLISVGPIRSAFSFPLTVTVENVTRTVSNPYGLILIKVTPQSAQDVTQTSGEDKKHEKK